MVGPAWRRATAAWVGCGIVAAVIFGGAGMRVSDLTSLALHAPGVGLVLTAIWLLVFTPTARLLVRAQPAAYLTSLPGNPRAARLITAAALLALQLPWLALWILGQGLIGAAVVVVTTALVVGIASWRTAGDRPATPSWQRAGEALRGIHRRALRRRAGDALIRGAGLSVLAGLAAGLLVRNNQLTGTSAGVLGAAVIAVVLVPAQVGPALVTLAAYRETAWLAQAFGISPRDRVAALLATAATVHLVAAAIAAATAMVLTGPSPWLAVLPLGVAMGTALVEVRTVLINQASPQIAPRVVVGAILSAASAVLCLTLLDAPGVLAFLAIGALALLLAP